MTTEVEDTEKVLKEIERVTNPWEIVSDDFRTITRTKFVTDEFITALTEGKTIRAPEDFGVSKYYRWARANNLILHRRKLGNFSIIWVTKNDSKAQ